MSGAFRDGDPSGAFMLRAVLDSMGEGLVTCDPRGNTVEWNAAALAMHGFSSLADAQRSLENLSEQFELRTLTGQVVSLESWPMSRVLRGETFSQWELHVARRDTGFRRVLAYSGTPVRDQSGQLVLAVLTQHDVTERHWAQAALEEQRAAVAEGESRFRQLAELIPNLAWMANADGWIHWYNQRWYEYTGTSPEQMEGWGWKVVQHPDYLDAVIARWQTSLQTGQPFEMEFPLRGRDGAFRTFLTRVQPLRDKAGHIVQWFGTNTDIEDQRRAAEELKQQEAQLRGVLEATPECVKIVAPDGSLLFMNPAGLCMIEADAFAMVHGACVFDLIVDEHRAEWCEYHRRVCAGERLSWEFEVVGLRGARRWMETHAVPLRMPDGRVAQLAVTREVTYRKRLELDREQLLEAERAARSEAERIGRLKDDFLATLSHELRTPLNAILGWSQLLRGGARSAEKLRQGIETIERNARLQAQLIEDLLDMSRLISGKVRLEIQRVELWEVIAAAVAAVLPTAQAKGVRLERFVDEHTGPVVGDPARLQQVVWNLLSNAIKFTPAGGKVQLVLQRVNSHVELVVSDTGVGIKPEFLPLVFDRFRQANSSITRKFGGLGLGLSIVKQLVEMHNGQVRATSPGENQGATFTVSLPLAIAHRHSEERKTSNPWPDALPDLEAPSLDGLRVLVVDDEPDARELLKRLLEEHGATAILAGSALEALERLRTERPDLIVSDIGMPDVDGYEFIRSVRALGSGHGGNTPAIAVTALARSEDRRRALLAGYQAHLAKPIETADLVALVASVGGRLGAGAA